MRTLQTIASLAIVAFIAGCSSPDNLDLKVNDSTKSLYKITKAVTIPEVGCTIYEVEYKTDPKNLARRYITLSQCTNGETSSRVNGSKGSYTDVHNISNNPPLPTTAILQQAHALAQQQQQEDKAKSDNKARKKLLATLSAEDRRLLGISK